MKLKTLSIFTSILFVISIIVYIVENQQGIDLVDGSYYIKGLDISKVQKITLAVKGKEKIALVRDGARFLLENHHKYPASTDRVNELIYKMASIQISEKISSGVSKDELKKYSLDKENCSYKLELYDSEGKKTLSFFVGKHQKNRGNFFFKENSDEIYLSKNRLWLQVSYKDYIDRNLVKIDASKIDKIDLTFDRKIELANRDGDYLLVSPKRKEFKADKVKSYFNTFNLLRFDDFYKYDDQLINGLKFKKTVKIQLKSKLIYLLSFAKKKDRYYVKAMAKVDEVPSKISISKDDGKEKLQSIEDIVKAQGEAQKFTLSRGEWVYQIDKATYEKIDKKLSEFL